MDEKQHEIAREAMAEAATAPDSPVTVTDAMPTGAAQVGGLPATPVNAATWRFLQAVSQVEHDLTPEDQATFTLYCRVHGATKAGRKALWRLARNPSAMWDAFLDWMDGLPVDELHRMLAEHFPDWLEVSEAQKIIAGDAPGDDEGNATGSPS